MWILTPEQPGGETHYLLCTKEYVVGRKNCDILLPNDQSISRAHAHLCASDQELIIKDSSKYGTFVNTQKLTAPLALRSGDKVTFGVFQSKFSVLHCGNPVVCSSSLDSDRKTLVSQALLTLGGKLVNSWTKDCTHLVMPSVKVTVKTISALLCCRPIVKPEFFSELSRSVQEKVAPPKAESFVPEIDEPSLKKEHVNLGAIPARKQLFTGKTFVFLTPKQWKRLSAAVGFGGGQSQCLEEGYLPRSLLESPQSCVVDLATNSSQSVLSASSLEWANSVRSIVQRKGLRVITESEIGLAAIQASCLKNCNPASIIGDSVPHMSLGIPNESLSENMAVDDTAIPAASQNITAYAVNTEPSQDSRFQVKRTDEMTSVGETPEKKQNRQRGEASGSQRNHTQWMVAETVPSSINIEQSTGAQRKKPGAKTTGGESCSFSSFRAQPSSQKNNGGPKAAFYKQSPQKLKSSPQVSPQKQSTLTNFFQPVSKKRLLDDDLSAVTSEPKRPTLESLDAKTPKTSTTSKLGSPPDLFEQPTEKSSAATSRKRKVMEEEIQMDELESIMSEDMDSFEEQLSGDQSREEQPSPAALSSFKQKLVVHAEESANKKQRVQQEESPGIKEQLNLKAGLKRLPRPQTEPSPVSINIKTAHPTDLMKTPVNCKGKPPRMKDPFDDDASFVEDQELVKAEGNQLTEEIPPKLIQIKQEVQESTIDKNLPRKLVLVEFRSLTVTTPLQNKQKPKQDGAYTENFKRFYKNNNSQHVAHIIRGADLLVHNRGQNSDLDEWLRDAAEEESQKRREEIVGDDLFRYNPTKQSRRR